MSIEEFANRPDVQTIIINPGATVVCDFCDEDYTDSNKTGGFLFQTKAVCPTCAPSMLETIAKYQEEHFIRARCPNYLSFRDWVYTLR